MFTVNEQKNILGYDLPAEFEPLLKANVLTNVTDPYHSKCYVLTLGKDDDEAVQIFVYNFDEKKRINMFGDKVKYQFIITDIFSSNFGVYCSNDVNEVVEKILSMCEKKI